MGPTPPWFLYNDAYFIVCFPILGKSFIITFVYICTHWYQISFQRIVGLIPMCIFKFSLLIDKYALLHQTYVRIRTNPKNVCKNDFSLTHVFFRFLIVLSPNKSKRNQNCVLRKFVVVSYLHQSLIAYCFIVGCIRLSWNGVINWGASAQGHSGTQSLTPFA